MKEVLAIAISVFAGTICGTLIGLWQDRRRKEKRVKKLSQWWKDNPVTKK